MLVRLEALRASIGQEYESKPAKKQIKAAGQKEMLPLIEGRSAGWPRQISALNQPVSDAFNPAGASRRKIRLQRATKWQAPRRQVSISSAS